MISAKTQVVSNISLGLALQCIDPGTTFHDFKIKPLFIRVLILKSIIDYVKEIWFESNKSHPTCYSQELLFCKILFATLPIPLLFSITT